MQPHSVCVDIKYDKRIEHSAAAWTQERVQTQRVQFAACTGKETNYCAQKTV